MQRVALVTLTVGLPLAMSTASITQEVLEGDAQPPWAAGMPLARQGPHALREQLDLPTRVMSLA